MTIDPMEGHRLTGGDATDLTPSEVRRRRLAALDNSNLSGELQPLFGHVPSTLGSLLVDEDEDLQAAIAMSLHEGRATAREETQERAHSSIARDDDDDKDTEKGSLSAEPFLTSFHSVMWDDATTTDNDKSRWLQQGIDIRDKMDIDSDPPPAFTSNSMLSIVGSSHRPWGLTQLHGGPCGVLAAVQAELLRLLLFGGRNPLEFPAVMSEDTLPTGHKITDELVREALAMSIAIIVARASLMPPAVNGDPNSAVFDKRSAQIVLPSPSHDSSYVGLTWDHLYPPDQTASETTNLKVYTISAPPLPNPSKRQKTHEPTSTDWMVPREMRTIQLAHAISKFLLQAPPAKEAPLEYFRNPGGVVLLTMSLVCSRGKDTIINDMDDHMGGTFTSQFGHCSQELMNLLLTGQAVSNVFDNTLTPSGGLTCRGIQSRPAIGYLTQLEAMRYCEVGGYYKSPRFPIWVIGSTSHFSVLFGEPSCLKESKSDILLEQCRRAFKSIQGAEENGFIPKDSLREVLEKLELHIGDDALYPVLCAMCDIGDAGIIVWDEFWKIASRLLTGATLESVLQREESGDSDSLPPLLLANGEFDEPDKKPAARVDESDKKPAAKVTFKEAEEKWDAKPPSVESDEEMARRLAEEWGASEINSPTAAAAAAARPSSPMDMDTVMSADEQLARKLQAEVWESEAQGSGAASVDAVSGSPTPTLDGELIALDGPDEEKSQFQEDSKMPAVTRKLDFEKFGNSFRLFHYNGLRGGNLAPLRVTRLTAEEAVGASVPLTNSGGASSGDKGPGATWDLEDVLRTKWPSCGIDFLGKSSPSID